MNPAGIYVQDQISLNKWTVNAGLRFDYLNSSYPAFDVAPRRYVPVAEHFEGADVLSWKDLSPRIAIDLRFSRTFDIGRSRLQANIDLYNVLNANFVATRNGNYGTNGATWLRPGAILPARLLKFGGQFNF
jgi:hypothetical protein